MRRNIGTVQGLWRYPVKSMRGESLEIAELTEHGMAGDRVWALRELDRGGIMSARVWPAMLQLHATCNDDAGEDPVVRIHLPDGTVMAAKESRASEVLSELLNRRLRLEPVRRERLNEAELEAIMRGEKYPPSRDFYDEDVLHLIATGTLTHLRELQPESDFDPRRFRANIYIDTGDEPAGFVEDSWLDGRLFIGDAKIVGIQPAIRCVMTTHPQPGLPRDPLILRTAAQHHRAYVGVFASIATPGMVRIGDEVLFENASGS